MTILTDMMVNKLIKEEKAEIEKNKGINPFERNDSKNKRTRNPQLQLEEHFRTKDDPRQ